MSSKDRTAQLTEAFLARVEATGLTDEATARAIGISPQFYSEVKNGKHHPTTAFMVGAVRAGLADNFAQVAEPLKEKVA